MKLYDLPEEVLLKIFGYLQLPDLLRTVSPVCRRFRNICHCPALWRHFRFDVFYNKSRFDHIFLHANYFRSLSFVSYVGQLRMEVPEQYIEDGLCCCTQLRELDISYNLSIVNFKFLFKMPNLEILNMEYCCNVDAKTAVLALKSLQCPKKVVMALCEQFTMEQICEIFCSSSSFVHIDIENCTRVSVNSSKAILQANPGLKCFLFTPSWGPPPKWVELMAENGQVTFHADLDQMFDRCMYPKWLLPEELDEL